MYHLPQSQFPTGTPYCFGARELARIIPRFKGTGREVGRPRASQRMAGKGARKRAKHSTYTSTGVRAPWVMEQPKAPAMAKREYRSMPLRVGVGGTAAAAFSMAALTLGEPVEGGAAAAAIVSVREGVSGNQRKENEMMIKKG